MDADKHAQRLPSEIREAMDTTIRRDRRRINRMLGVRRSAW